MLPIEFDRLRLRLNSIREHALRIMEAGLDGVSPGRLVRASVLRRDDVLSIDGARYPLRRRRVLLLGAGKAAAGVARELEVLLGDALSAGVVVVRHGYATTTARVRVLEGGHPLPDEAGLAGAEALEALARTVREGNLVLCAFSGGASALLSQPPPGTHLEDLQELYRLLLESGMPIDDVNVVRRHVAPLLGGGSRGDSRVRKW